MLAFFCGLVYNLFVRGSVCMQVPNMLEAKKRDKNALIENYNYKEVKLDESLVGKKYYVRTYGCQMNVHDG